VRIIAIVAALFLVMACTGESRERAAIEPPQGAITSLATTRQVMLGITVPTSNVVFGVGEKAPATDAEWEQLQASAMSLAESANLLKVDGRRVEAQEWLKYVDDLIAASRAAAQATQERNADKVLEAGDQIYAACDACHKKYLSAAATGKDGQ
jgi:hypothetical protein